MAPLAFLAAYDLLRCLQSETLTSADIWIAGYIMVGLLLWIALLAVTDLPRGGRIASRVVWGLHVHFNVLAIPFWISWDRAPNRSFAGFPGLGFVACLVVLPVLAISTTCFLLTFFNKNHNL